MAAGWLAAGWLTAGWLAAAARPAKPHVLFVVSDDLRPTLGAYGTAALTPNINGLAKRGVTFTRAYTQFPWCSPSRQSFLSGRRPDTTRAWTFTTSFRDTFPNAVSLPQHFRQRGWHTVSVGKIFHGKNCVRGDPGCCPANATFKTCVQQPVDADWADGNGSWDEHPIDFPRVTCARAMHTATDGKWWCEVDDRPESHWCDSQVANAAVEKIHAHAENSTGPLFLAVGFRDNHLPWAAPPRWRVLFNPNSSHFTAHPAPPNFTVVPKQAWQYPAWVGEEYNLSETRWLQPPVLREAMRSYMSNIALTDQKLGLVLQAMEQVRYLNNTIVLFTGDHGQNLGEHNTWTKMTAWEHSLRVPLIISVPWLQQSHGKMHWGMAEMIDFYRTLSDLAGINASFVDPGVEGDTLAPAVADPSGSPPKLYAFSQTQRISVAHLRSLVPYTNLPMGANEFYDPSCFSTNDKLEWMGYSVRTSLWRFTEWVRWNGSALCPIATNSSSIEMLELYSHSSDHLPLDLDVSEYDNVADSNPTVVNHMRGILRKHIRYCS